MSYPFNTCYTITSSRLAFEKKEAKFKDKFYKKEKSQTQISIVVVNVFSYIPHVDFICFGEGSSCVWASYMRKLCHIQITVKLCLPEVWCCMVPQSLL